MATKDTPTTTPVSGEALTRLIKRLERGADPNNALDIEIEIALFKPDSHHVSVRPNDAGTKLVYQRPDGRTDTHWAADYTLNRARREQAIALLRAALAAIPTEPDHARG